MLAQRLATAAAGIPVVLALILVGGTLYTAAVAVILVLGVLEFFAATDPELKINAHPRLRAVQRPWYRPRLPALIGGASVVLMVAALDSGFDEWSGALVLAIAVTFLFLVLRADPDTGLRDWMWIIAGVTYVGFLGSHLVLLRDLDGDGDWALLAVFSTFAADTAAYVVGRTIGRTYITPAISPGKTLEGTIGGLVTGFAAVFALNWITGLDADAQDLIPLALLLPFVAFVGDLGESLVKRGAGVKDTSELIPGHGGFLDRLDSILFTTPLVYYFVIWAIR
ncbi:MAG: phosphatidate cytidylyltransferase [Dehalococcoidia bacterium]|nr:phosphatidate cytidylyltransferase [Dehalococcoidia bacterium]